MISENQEISSVQSLEQKEIEKLELDLIKKKQRVATVEQKISFRPKGKNSKWTEQLIKSRSMVQDIINRINHLKMVEDDKITEVFLKDYEEAEKVRKEHERILSLFEAFKENVKTKKDKPELKTTPKPDFNAVGINWKKDRNYQGRLKIAQKVFDMAKLRAENSSPVGKSGRTGALQVARNALDSALKAVENEDYWFDFYTLRAEKEWLETVLAEREAYSKDIEAYIAKTKKDLALFEKHGFIKAENLT